MSSGIEWTDRTLSNLKGGDPTEWPEDLRIRMAPGDHWSEPAPAGDAP
jgi:hypothetical protein